MRLPHKNPMFSHTRHRVVALGLIALLLSACSFTLNPDSLPTSIISLPAAC